MSENERSGRGHDSRERVADRDPLAWAAEVTAEGDDPADGVRITTFDSPAIPSSRLGRMESPVETYAIMRPVPNSRPWTAADDEWVRSFARPAQRGEESAVVIAPPAVRGSTGKTSIGVDYDPQGNVTRWDLDPEITTRMCGDPTAWGPCRALIGTPAPNCPNPYNHPRGGR
ncbi:hypothetical protein ABZ352_19040 [Streptomyces griseofuscus]|uniref:hypothetical protein n=1 Tax=Streptomyces griseofuscus TaxID=146922 RepID=UPI0033CB3B08